MEIYVRAIPEPKHEYRWRAGQRWGAEPRKVRVVENPADHKRDKKGGIESFSDEISPAQYAQLMADPRIAVWPVGGTDPQLIGEKAKVAELQAELEKARAAKAEADEEIEVLKRNADLAMARIETAAELKIKQLTAELEAMRAKLQKAQAEAPVDAPAPKASKK